ncbi:MAG: hypothetical protein KDD42_09255, partial [Bdellovibrionales bacterium]|nr:hypothetical protein [Bdellovibrionales bacterium]
MRSYWVKLLFRPVAANAVKLYQICIVLIGLVFVAATVCAQGNLQELEKINLEVGRLSDKLKELNQRESELEKEL